MLKLTIPAGIENISEGMEFIENALNKYHISHKNVIKTLLIAEEMLVRLIDANPPSGQIKIAVRPYYGMATITLSAPGDALSEDVMPFDLSTGDMDHDCEDGIRSLLLRAFSDRIAYSRKGEYNYVKIAAGSQEHVFALRTLIAFGGAVLVSAILTLFLSEALMKQLIDYILLPIQSIFLNALQLVTAPTIFFSIVGSVSRYSSFSDPGKVSLKIIIGYVVLSFIASIVGISVFNAFQAYINPIDSLPMADVIERNGSSWLLDMIVNIVPSNIIDPFLKTDAMQLLLTALLGGLALGRAGQYSSTLRGISDALEKFFSTSVEIVSSSIPLAVFFATILMILHFGWSSMKLYLQLFLLVMLGFTAMIAIYMILILCIAHLNPITFIRKYAPSMWNVFLLGSGLSAIPETIRFCEKKLGISSKVYSFSIPFGAIANLDGNCVYLSIAALFLAKLCGVQVTGTAIIGVILVIFILSIGSPITPGSVILALSMLMNQVGVSLTIISFVLALNALIEMILAMCNTVGDVAITLVVARTEKLVNTDVYRKK